MRSCHSDRHDDFAPGDYYLPPYSPSLQLGEQKNHKRTPHDSGKNKSARRKVHMSVRVRIFPKGSSRRAEVVDERTIPHTRFAAVR